MKKICFIVMLFVTMFDNPAFADKVLLSIGNNGKVTEQQLEAAMQAAPFATQFPAMDENDQAYLRGDMLLRLARAEALYQEAVAVGKNKSRIFQQEMSNFKTGLLAQRYIAKLRQEIEIPEELQQNIATGLAGNSDAETAAESVYVAKHFNRLKKERINTLKAQAKVETYYERFEQSPSAETVLAKGEGLLIKYADLVLDAGQRIDTQQGIDKVEEWIELILLARAAEKVGENIDGQLQEYAHNLTVRLLLAEKEQQWLAGEGTLLDYFQRRPDIGFIPERRQIGQIVLASREEAEQMQARIRAGESLFQLAAQYSIDDYGRQRAGDMGWLTQGSASKEIEEAIKDLKDNELSDIIQTDKGWHLITIVNRKPSEHKAFAAIEDRIKQKFLAEKMTEYLQQVMAKYPLQWFIAERPVQKLVNNGG